MTRSPRRRPVAFTETLSTSFLDVLSNGLGAGILLMVLIAAIPIERPAARVPNSPFIRASWTVTGDPGAILSLRLLPPDGETYNVDLRGNEMGAAEYDCRWPGVTAAGGMELYGYAVSGPAAATIGDRTSGDRTYVLWIAEPTAGEWKLRVSYANRDDSIRNGGLKAISLRSALETHAGIIDGGDTVLSLPFGKGVETRTFTIDEYGADEETRDLRTPCRWL